jgi:hypothetical protein
MLTLYGPAAMSTVRWTRCTTLALTLQVTFKDAQRSNAELVTVAAIQKAPRLDGWRQMMPTADGADLE